MASAHSSLHDVTLLSGALFVSYFFVLLLSTEIRFISQRNHSGVLVHEVFRATCFNPERDEQISGWTEIAKLKIEEILAFLMLYVTGSSETRHRLHPVKNQLSCSCLS